MSNNWPDWKDAGKVVTITAKSGERITGKLEVADFFPDDSGDEVPVFSVIDSSGVEHSFAGADSWEYASS